MLKAKLLIVLLAVAILANVSLATGLPFDGTVDAYFTTNGNYESFDEGRLFTSGTSNDFSNYKRDWFDGRRPVAGWAKAHTGPMWYWYKVIDGVVTPRHLTIEIDLGAVYDINEINIEWKADKWHAYGTEQMDLFLGDENENYTLDEQYFVPYRTSSSFPAGTITFAEDTKTYVVDTTTARYIKITGMPGYAYPTGGAFGCITEISLDITPLQGTLDIVDDLNSELIPEPASLLVLAGGSVITLWRRRIE